MAGFVISGATLLRCAFLFFYVSVCLCQRDCTGVDCPQLENCIEEALERGACCASCLQKGCTCEGYQYYDCINAGFKNGKVPERDSYFVDYGSTECSCPAGGGRISCHFISCPDLPPNCIEVSEPADGCMQCQRVGCVHDGQQYEAGYPYHIDSCQVCHCPNEGGKLMCYPVPDCDPDKVQKPVLASITEGNQEGHTSQDNLVQRGHMDHSTPYGGLPLFKFPLKNKAEAEDYDYNPTDSPETYPRSLVFSTQSSSKTPSVSHGSERTSSIQSFGRQGKLELREQYGVHDHPADKEEVTESPLKVQLHSSTHTDSTPSWQSSQGVRSTQSVSENVKQLHVHKTPDTVKFPINQGLESEKQPEHPRRISEIVVHHQRGSESETHHQNLSDTVTPSSSLSQPSITHPIRDADIPADQYGQSDRITFPLYMQKSTQIPVHPQPSSHGHRLEGTALPEYDEGVDEEITEDEDELPPTFHSSAGPEGADALDQIKSAQEEGNHKEPESSHGQTTPEASTSSPPRTPHYQTTPMVHFTTIPTTTTTQLPVEFIKDEREPSKKPAEELFSRHHGEKLEEATEAEGQRKDDSVSPHKPEG